MADLSDDTKAIVASNLTVAAFMRDLLNHLKNEKPLSESDDYAVARFNHVLKAMESQE